MTLPLLPILILDAGVAALLAWLAVTDYRAGRPWRLHLAVCLVLLAWVLVALAVAPMKGINPTP